MNTGKSLYSFHGQTALGDELNKKLQGREWYDEADKMLVDPIISGLTWMVSSTITGADWAIEGGKDHHREFITSVFDKSFKQTLESAVRCFWYGSYAFEQQYYLRDDGYIVDRLLPRQPHTFQRYQRDDQGRLVKIEQTTQNGTGCLPIQRTILLIRNSEGWQNLRGRAILRACYQPWLLKTEHRFQDLVGAQRFASGVLDIEMTEGATEADSQKAELLARNYNAGNAYIVRRPSHNIKSLNIIQASGTPYTAEEKVKEYNREMGIAFIGQFLLMDGGSLGGAQALVTESVERFYAAIGSLATDLAEQITAQRIHRLIKLNFGDYDKDDTPELTFSGINKTNFAELSDFVQKMEQRLPADFFGASDWGSIKAGLGLTGYETGQTTDDVELSQGPARHELESFVKFDQIEPRLDKETEILTGELSALASKMIETYLKFAVPNVVKGDVDKLKTMEPRYVDEIHRAITGTIDRMSDYGASTVRDEAKAQGRINLDAGKDAKDSKKAKTEIALLKAKSVSDGIASAVVEQGTELIAQGTVLDQAQVQAALEQAATRRAKAIVIPSAYALVASAYSSGRQEEAGKLNPTRTIYSAVMDKGTCAPCAENDGAIVVDGLPAAPNPVCLGGGKCRCVHVYEFDK